MLRMLLVEQRRRRIGIDCWSASGHLVMVRGNIQVGLEVLGNLSDESLEGELSDEELGRSTISSSC